MPKGKRKINNSEKWIVDAAIKSQKQPEEESKIIEEKVPDCEEKLDKNNAATKRFIKDWQIKNFGRAF